MKEAAIWLRRSSNFTRQSRGHNLGARRQRSTTRPRIGIQYSEGAGQLQRRVIDAFAWVCHGDSRVLRLQKLG